MLKTSASSSLKNTKSSIPSLHSLIQTTLDEKQKNALEDKLQSDIIDIVNLQIDADMDAQSHTSEQI